MKNLLAIIIGAVMFGGLGLAGIGVYGLKKDSDNEN